MCIPHSCWFLLPTWRFRSSTVLQARSCPSSSSEVLSIKSLDVMYFLRKLRYSLKKEPFQQEISCSKFQPSIFSEYVTFEGGHLSLLSKHVRPVLKKMSSRSWLWGTIAVAPLDVSIIFNWKVLCIEYLSLPFSHVCPILTQPSPYIFTSKPTDCIKSKEQHPSTSIFLTHTNPATISLTLCTDSLTKLPGALRWQLQKKVPGWRAVVLQVPVIAKPTLSSWKLFGMNFFKRNI